MTATAAATDPIAEWIDRIYHDVPGQLVVAYEPAAGRFNGAGGYTTSHAQAINRIRDLDRAGAKGVYLRVTTVNRELGPYERGTGEDSHYLPGLWADLDYGSIGHRHDPAKHDGLTLPPDADEAMRIIAGSGLPEPSLWVDSGGGLYPWWIFDDPVAITDGNRATFERVSASWQILIEQAAARLGYFYGRGVGDLARVLRVPGTMNRKEGQQRPCRVIEDAGVLWPVADILSVIADQSATLTAAQQATPEPDHTPSPERGTSLAGSSGTNLYGASPLDEYADSHSWADILTPHGWQVCRGRHSPAIQECFTRPGKPEHSCSAHVLVEQPNVLVVWSEEANLPTGAGRRLTKARLAAHLDHRGDLKAFRRSLLPATVPVAPAAEVSVLDDFWRARPILAHIQQAALAQYAAPWAVLGCVLARVLTLAPWTITLPPIVGGPASLNFAIAITGLAGGGKGAADGVARQVIRWPYLPEMRIGSGEAIAHCLKHRTAGNKKEHIPPGTEWNRPDRNVLVNMAEVDKLTGQAQRQGSTIMPELRSAWMGEALGHVTADQTRRIPVEAMSYRLCLILGVQPARAGFLLDDADGGFPQRLIWMNANDPNAPEVKPDCPDPIAWHPPNVSWNLGADRQIPVCTRAVQEIRTARQRSLRGEGDPLDGHRLLSQEKIAAALGMLDDRYTISDEDWQLAETISAVSAATRERVQTILSLKAAQAEQGRTAVAARRAVATAEATAEASLGRVARNLMRHLERAGADGLSWGELRRKLPSRDRELVDDAIDRLAEDGRVTITEHPHPTAPGGYAKNVKTRTST